MDRDEPRKLTDSFHLLHVQMNKQIDKFPINLKGIYDRDLNSSKIIPTLIPLIRQDEYTEILLCEMNFFRAIRCWIRRPFPVTPRLISSWLFGCSLLISRESCLFPRTGKSCRASELSANMETYVQFLYVILEV